MEGQLRKRTAGTVPLAENSGGIDDNAGSERNPSIRVFLALENRLLREILARMLRRHGGLELAGRNGPGGLTAEEINRSECDVLLLDFIDPEWLSFAQPQSECEKKVIQIVAIGMDCDHEKFLEAVGCGVTGYLLKDASSTDIVAAVRAAATGEAVCPSQLCAVLFKEVAQIQRRRQVEKQRGSTPLTLRQQNLMKLVATGLTNKEIAEELGLSEFTVKNHVSRILRQLGAGNRSEAAAVVEAWSQMNIRGETTLSGHA